MNYRQEYEKWLASPALSEEERAELKAIANDEKEIENRFYGPLEFGTAGLRGTMYVGLHNMNRHVIRWATQGFANVIRAEGEAAMQKGVAICMDCRNHSTEFAREAACVMAGNGIAVRLFESLRPTPELSFAVREYGCTAGSIGSASHIPMEYNGFKVYWADGAQLPEGFTMSDAGVVSSDGSLAEGDWTFDIKLNGIDGYITLGAQAVIRVVDALHVSTTSLKVGEAANVTVDAPYYAYESLVKVNPRFVSTVKHTDGTPVAQGEMQGFGGKTILPGTGDSVGGTLRIQNWYWKDASQVQGNNYDGLGALAFADIEATDARDLESADGEAGNFYQAYLYVVRVSDEDAAKLAEYGLAAETGMAPVTAYQGITYDYNSALAITGTPTKAGEVEITVTLQIPLVRGFGSRFPNNVHVGSPTATEVTRTFTLTIGE